MAAQLGDLARSAPKAARGVRPVTTWREDLTTMAIAFWPITALFFDGRGHNNSKDVFRHAREPCCRFIDRS